MTGAPGETAAEPGAAEASGPLDRRRPRALFAIVLAFIALAGTAGSTHRFAHSLHSSHPLGVGAVLLLVVAPLVVAFLLRRRAVAVVATVAALSVYVLVGYPLGPVFGSTEGVLVGLILTGPVRSGRIAAWSGLGALVVLLPAAYLGREGSLPALAAMAGGLAWSCVLLLLAGALRGRYDRVTERRERARDTARRREVDAVTAERLRIARELHDVLAHSLSAITVQAGVGLHLLDRDVEQARSALTQVRATSRDALDEVRAVLGIVRAEDDEGDASRTPHVRRAPAWTLAALPRLIDEFGLPGGPSAVLDMDLPDDPARTIAPHVAGVVYRVVQEALTNVRRHAATASRVDVRVRAEADGVDGSRGVALRVVVRDDGPGPEPASGDDGLTGYGLLGMRERVTAAGGSVRTGVRDDGLRGFEIVALVPLRTGVRDDDAARGTAHDEGAGA